jgi:hypothetical protein
MERRRREKLLWRISFLQENKMGAHPFTNCNSFVKLYGTYLTKDPKEREQWLP